MHKLWSWVVLHAHNKQVGVCVTCSWRSMSGVMEGIKLAAGCGQDPWVCAVPPAEVTWAPASAVMTDGSPRPAGELPCTPPLNPVAMHFSSTCVPPTPG